LNSSILLENKVIEQTANYSIPVLLNYGCESKQRHNFSEVQMIYGENALKVLSGGVVSEWLENLGTTDLGTW
jgi:glycosyl hydrolase family 72 (putative glucanosyltransferase)